MEEEKGGVVEEIINWVWIFVAVPGRTFELIIIMVVISCIFFCYIKLPNFSNCLSSNCCYQCLRSSLAIP